MGFWRAAGEMLTLLKEHPQLQVSPPSTAGHNVGDMGDFKNSGGRH